jgi:AraC-like DNA-binding protein
LNAHAGTVAEIAYKVGFKSHSHFSAAFRETFGVSPSEHVPKETADHHPEDFFNPD